MFGLARTHFLRAAAPAFLLTLLMTRTCSADLSLSLSFNPNEVTVREGQPGIFKVTVTNTSTGTGNLRIQFTTTAIVVSDPSYVSGDKDDMAFNQDVTQDNLSNTILGGGGTGSFNVSFSTQDVSGIDDHDFGKWSINVHVQGSSVDGDRLVSIDKQAIVYVTDPGVIVPEPSALTTFGIGAIGILGYALRRGKRGRAPQA